MIDAFNPYGDCLISPSANKGADIASQRLDDLDRAALAELTSRQAGSTTCIELGCGLGAQGLRFAKLGANAWLYDTLPEPVELATLKNAENLSLNYCRTDVRALTGKSLPARIHIAFSQRFIHHLEWEDACKLIELVYSRMARNARFYLSASGLNSELRQGYADADKPIQMRFARLDAAMQSKHAIREPVCLYTRDDLAQLMETQGFATIEIWESEFGNIKGIFESHFNP